MRQSNLQAYNVIDYFENIISSSSTKFLESVDVAVRLNVNVRKSEEQVKGVVVLPNGIGKDIRVAVFTDDDSLLKELEFVVDVIGGKDLVSSIKEGKKLDVDWCVTTYSFVEYIKPIAKILGPKGLMPDPKFNTLTSEVVKTVNIIKSGQIKFKTDKYGIIHAKIGNLKFSARDLFVNFMTLMKAIKGVRPTGIKGIYFKDVFISSTMGQSFKIDKIEEMFSFSNGDYNEA